MRVQLRPNETFYGLIETSKDALIICEAVRREKLARVKRRLSDNERNQIRSGSVFVYDEKEAGIKRWCVGWPVTQSLCEFFQEDDKRVNIYSCTVRTDGRTWSPSRIHGNFLLYRELDKKLPRSYSEAQVFKELQRLGLNDRHTVTSSKGTFVFAVGGLLKKTISVTIPGGKSLHVVSYFTQEDIDYGRLNPPRAFKELARMDPPAELYVQPNFRRPLKASTVSRDYEESIDAALKETALFIDTAPAQDLSTVGELGFPCNNFIPFSPTSDMDFSSWSHGNAVNIPTTELRSGVSTLSSSAPTTTNMDIDFLFDNSGHCMDLFGSSPYTSTISSSSSSPTLFDSPTPITESIACANPFLDMFPMDPLYEFGDSTNCWNSLDVFSPFEQFQA